MIKNIKLDLSNNQALHLWGMMVSYIHDTTNELKRVGIFTNQGELKKSRNIEYLAEFRQEQLDNLALANLIYKHIEATAEFPELETEATEVRI